MTIKKCIWSNVPFLLCHNHIIDFPKKREKKKAFLPCASNWHNNPPEPIPEKEEDALKRITKADQQNLFVKRELYTV